MTTIQQKASKLANSLVQKLWSTHWVYNERSFESSKSAAIIVARIMMKDYREYGMSPVEQRYYVLKALPKAIYSLNYNKK